LADLVQTQFDDWEQVRLIEVTCVLVSEQAIKEQPTFLGQGLTDLRALAAGFLLGLAQGTDVESDVLLLIALDDLIPKCDCIPEMLEDA